MMETVILILPVYAHLGGQVARPEKDHVDTVHRRDGVGSLDGLGGLDHHHHDGGTLEFGHQVPGGTRLIATDRVRAGDRPMTSRRESGRIDHRFGLRLRIDMRDYDSHCPTVEHPGYDAGVLRRDADQARDARADRAGAEHRRRFERCRRVFEIDVDGVVSARRCDRRDLGSASALQRQTQHQITAEQCVSKRLLHTARLAHRER
jgi:hypothetical protein